MMKVRPGIFLEDNRPARSQFRVGRRSPVRSVIVVHTAESGTDRSGSDPKAEAVASFIQRRSDPGSYHLIGDADSIIQLVRFENEAFHDATGSNRWSIGISLAMNAADWASLPPERSDELVRSAAWMARMAGDWLEEHGPGRPAARFLTRAQSDKADASGFISHARRDPDRRTDPGRGFPWKQFFRYYTEGDTAIMTSTIEVPDPHVLSIQERCDRMGFDPGPFDGIPGPKTDAAVGEMADELLRRRAEVPAPQVRPSDVDARDAGLWRRYRAAVGELAAVNEIAEREAVDQ